MNTSIPYIAITIGVLALIVVALLIFWINKKRPGKRLSVLAGLAFACIVAGVVFSENRLVGYGLMGVGVILAVVDALMKSRSE
jgi:hypothetical protein